MLPAGIRNALDCYVSDHRPVGAFLTAVLSNDLRMAVGHADDANLPLLPEIVRYCHWELPGRCWGSPAKVAAWLGSIEPVG